MNKTDADFIKKVHEEMLGGTYSPERLDKAYLMVSKEHETFFANVQQKKRAIAGFVQYVYPELKFTADTPKTVKQPVELEKDKPEVVELEKPTTAKKKRVYKRRPKTNKKDV